MARKLGLGLGVICTCVVLAGCQSGAGSRFANNQNRPPAGAFARQGTTMPPPNFPNANQNGGFSTSTNNGAFPVVPNNNPNNGGFAPQNVAPINATSNPPGVPPQGPQGFGTPTTTNRNNVQITAPGNPNFPPPPAQPGISPIPPAP